MDPPEELQQLEITALQSIYDQDFIECPPPTVWKVRLAVYLVQKEC
jgi:eukaryotic translation initiation factor 2-alpha kinase 4